VPVDEVSVTTDPPSITVLQPAPVMDTVPPSPPELPLPPELLLAPELLPPELLAPELLPPEPLLPELLAPPELLLAPELLPPSALLPGVPPPLPELLLLQADVRAPPRTATAAHRPARRKPFVSWPVWVERLVVISAPRAWMFCFTSGAGHASYRCAFPCTITPERRSRWLEQGGTT
jgi:hypothetical protein